ncbi:protein kinase domain-containing protein [Streptomyces sp. NRAIS4]
MVWQDEADPVSIGHYQVDRRIGSGGMGVVYLAASPSGREVAVKVVRRRYAEDPEFRDRFRREVAAARQVSGAFTAPVVDADPDAESPWMATTYIPAPPLSARVTEDGPLASDDVWNLARGLAEALRDIHRAGLVHRDLKPSNVLLTEDGPRVIDFGISRVVDSEPFTRTGKVMGTPPYMSPEQLRSPRDTGPAADVFALGSVLTYAATGHGPFDADLAGVPDQLRQIIQICLCKAPEDRPTPDELLALLGSRKPLRPIARRDSRRRRLTKLRRGAVAGIITLALCAAAVSWRAFEGQRQPNGDAGPTRAPSQAPTGPAVEPAAEVRPRGWALWEKPLLKPLLKGKVSAAPTTPTCTEMASALICSADGLPAARLDPRNGRVLWHVPVRTGQYENEGGTVMGTADGLVFVHTGVRDQLLALDLKTGHQQWSLSLPSLDHFVISGSTIAVSQVFAEGNQIKAIDVVTGKQLASTTTDGNVLLAGSKGDVFMVRTGARLDSSSSLVSLEPRTLRIRWTKSLPKDTGEAVEAKGDDVTFVYRGQDGEGNRELVHFNVKTSTARRVPLQKPINGRTTLDGTTLFVSRPDGTAAAYDTATGKRLWITSTGAESPGDPVIAQGLLYTLAADGRITCLKASTGRQLWHTMPRRDANRGIDDPFRDDPLKPAIFDGVAYAGSNTGTIFAIAPPTLSPPTKSKTSAEDG